MGFSAVLDVVIGLSFTYLLLALICSWVNEQIASWLNRRGTYLFEGIRGMIRDQNVLDSLVAHPLIASLCGGPTAKPLGGSFPAQIPAATFATVLLELVASPGGAASGGRFAQASNAIAALPDPALRQALQTIVNRADNDIDALRKGIEDWYGSVTDRISGWYKLHVQQILLVLGFFGALILNVDTFQLARELWNSPTLREQVVIAAQGVVKSGKLEEAVTTKPAEIIKQVAAEKDPRKQNELLLKWASQPEIAKVVKEAVESAHWPLGWKGVSLPWEGTKSDAEAFWNVLVKLLGFLVTGCAVALGAPFWFDMVNKLFEARGSGKKQG